MYLTWLHFNKCVAELTYSLEISNNYCISLKKGWLYRKVRENARWIQYLPQSPDFLTHINKLLTMRQLPPHAILDALEILGPSVQKRCHLFAEHAHLLLQFTTFAAANGMHAEDEHDAQPQPRHTIHRDWMRQSPQERRKLPKYHLQEVHFTPAHRRPGVRSVGGRCSNLAHTSFQQTTFLVQLRTLSPLLSCIVSPVEHAFLV